MQLLDADEPVTSLMRPIPVFGPKLVICTELLLRCRSRGAKDRYQSPMRSGSVPHSPYPQENKIKRSSKRSPSPREDRTHSGEGLSSKQVSESKGQYSQSFKVSFTVLQPTLRAF
ncbi:uncharacterized protein LOC120290394 isoform X2 [Eucalyptus grandis]|uniref:uncharacterized protein LOC120290394 isoform X2 n=1 Tax=Eucalyptus grandis TaxID=71139 RepID=UPI00192EE1F1|nr:uncharacterized protein LOC120290394 isoform X2 [Eucalyptus grandis]XP_039162443.1 uncharacterized protein LOC120290394 isoform X2 [Eucalyptus grandis]